MARDLKWVLAFAAGGFAAVAVAVFLFILDRHEGFFDPVYDPDGKYVYFIKRQTAGISWGLGIEFFTAPASVLAFTDVVSLRRLDTATGAEEELERWTESPIAWRRIENYRGRLFQSLSAQLRAEKPGEVEYIVSMTVTRQPQSERHRIKGRWTVAGSGQRGEWEQGLAGMGGNNVTPLFGDSELITVPGREAFPAAIISYDHVKETNRVLVKNSDFEVIYGDRVPLEISRDLSRRDAIERLQAITDLKDALVEKFEALGESSRQAALSVIKELQRLGYYPKDPTITARRLDGDEAAADNPPLFIISPTEMQSGIFADIAEAVEKPATAATWRDSKYLTYEGYDTSARLNAHLEAGFDTFRVRFDGRVYLLTIDRKPE